MRRLRRLTGVAFVAAGIALVAVSLVSPSASADAALRVGWWNLASPAPAPTAPAGGIHVAVTPGHVVAYGAVLYQMPATAQGTLDLPVAQTTGSGTVQACPTTTTNWKGGDDQPSPGPTYDCSHGAFSGLPSADGKTMEFLVDGSVDTSPGQLSLAIVPVMTDQVPELGSQAPTDTTQPFTIDFSKPAVTSLTVTGGGPSSSATPPPPPPLPTGSTAGLGTGSTGNAGSASVPSLSLPAASTVTTGQDQQAPQVAGQQSAPATTMSPSTPAAASSSATSTAHNMALALLILLGLTMVAGGNGPRRAPRILAGPKAGTEIASATVPVAAAPRGLGRFAKPRSNPPHPLL